MKKLVLSMMAMALAACSAPVQQSSVPMDMQTVQEYQQRVANAQNNIRSAEKQSDFWVLNQSDNKPKIVVVHQPSVYPSAYYGYGNKHPRLYSGIGVRLGHYHYY